MFISLFATPGYNMSLLRHFGFEEEYVFFTGQIKIEDNLTHFFWGNETLKAKGKKEEVYILI